MNNKFGRVILSDFRTYYSVTIIRAMPYLLYVKTNKEINEKLEKTERKLFNKVIQWERNNLFNKGC